MNSELRAVGHEKAGSLSLGLNASVSSGVRAALGYRHHLQHRWGTMSAFASAYAEYNRHFDAGVMAGVRLEW